MNATRNQEYIELRGGFSFPWYFQLMALFLLITGIAIISTSFYLEGLQIVLAILGGLFLVFGGAYMISSQFGTQVSIDNNQVREYHSRFFLKTGEMV